MPKPKDVAQTRVNGQISIEMPSGVVSLDFSNVAVGEAIAVLRMLLTALEKGEAQVPSEPLYTPIMESEGE